MPEKESVEQLSCPRCGETLVGELYGPCPACCSQLRASMAGTAREVAVADYEPKMNVVPNQVATKD